MEAVRLLLQNCAEINSQLSTAQSTPLHGASYFGFPKITQLLLDCGADPNLKNVYKATPLQDLKHAKVDEKLKQQIIDILTQPITATIEHKYVKGTNHLVYGEKLLSFKISGIFHQPTITMAQEASRDQKTNIYNDYKEAVSKAKSLLKHKFATDAGLTEEEVIALRFYTSKSGNVINLFIENLVGSDTKDHSQLLSSQNTWVQTITHIQNGIIKLLDIFDQIIQQKSIITLETKTTTEDIKTATNLTTDSTITEPPPTLNSLDTRSVSVSYVQVDGEDDVSPVSTNPTTNPTPNDTLLVREIHIPLPSKFFADTHGMIAATEYAFMSAFYEDIKQDSQNDEQPAEDSKHQQDQEIKFIIKCRSRDAGGYHCGVNLDWLAVNSMDQEVVFPLGTFFQILKRERDLMKNSTNVTVVPIYIKPPQTTVPGNSWIFNVINNFLG